MGAMQCVAAGAAWDAVFAADAQLLCKILEDTPGLDVNELHARTEVETARGGAIWSELHALTLLGAALLLRLVDGCEPMKEAVQGMNASLRLYGGYYEGEVARPGRGKVLDVVAVLLCHGSNGALWADDDEWQIDAEPWMVGDSALKEFDFDLPRLHVIVEQVCVCMPD